MKMGDDGEGDEDAPGYKKRKKTTENKGNWTTLPYTPRLFELHPCPHKWKAHHKEDPCPRFKSTRWVFIPMSERMDRIAIPPLRRLLALWLEYADKFSPEMREHLKNFIIKWYGLTAEFLEHMLEEARRAREAALKKGKKGRKGRRRKRKRRKGKGKSGLDDGFDKGKDAKKGDELQFKRRKAGKLPLDWAYNMGSKFLLKCIATLSQDPDEEFNSRAPEYFDIQAMAILEQVCQYMDMPLPDPERPTQYGETLVIMALNLSDWIAKYITSPARLIPDDKVEEYLALKGIRPKPPKIEPKAKPKKPEPPPKGKKGVAKETISEPMPEPDTEVQRNWDELKSPVYVPEKTRISKRKPAADGDYGEDGENYLEPEPEPEAEPPENKDSEEDGRPRWQKATLNDIKKEFLEYINWYNPWEPEFMYLGKRITPKGVLMFKLWDVDSDEVPDDLRALQWNLTEHGYYDNYSFIPYPVPKYYPALRPLWPVRLEDLERSGISREIIKRHLRFFSPWFIMNKPLTPPPSPPPASESAVEGTLEHSEAESENPSKEAAGEYGEVGEVEGDLVAKKPVAAKVEDEVFDDEMLKSAGPPPVKDSLWGDNKMKEQIEILGHILHLMSSIPDLTVEHILELLEEFCEAVECAELDENSDEANHLLLLKRTIILEQYFVDFFTVKFRDFNDRTSYYMRVLCRRCAYYVQLLYEHTARNLWELQSRENPPTPIPTPPVTPDNPEAVQDWDEWLNWLLSLTDTCDEWAGWITETVDEAERKAAKKKGAYIGPDGKKVRLTTEEWYEWKDQVEQQVCDYRSRRREFVKDSPYYLERAKHLPTVKSRAIPTEWQEEEGEWEGEGEYGEDGWEDVAEEGPSYGG